MIVEEPVEESSVWVRLSGWETREIWRGWRGVDQEEGGLACAMWPAHERRGVKVAIVSAGSSLARSGIWVYASSDEESLEQQVWKGHGGQEWVQCYATEGDPGLSRCQGGGMGRVASFVEG